MPNFPNWVLLTVARHHSSVTPCIERTLLLLIFHLKELSLIQHNSEIQQVNYRMKWKHPHSHSKQKLNKKKQNWLRHKWQFSFPLGLLSFYESHCHQGHQQKSHCIIMIISNLPGQFMLPFQKHWQKNLFFWAMKVVYSKIQWYYWYKQL